MTDAIPGLVRRRNPIQSYRRLSRKMWRETKILEKEATLGHRKTGDSVLSPTVPLATSGRGGQTYRQPEEPNTRKRKNKTFFQTYLSPFCPLLRSKETSSSLTPVLFRTAFILCVESVRKKVWK